MGGSTEIRVELDPVRDSVTVSQPVFHRAGCSASATLPYTITAVLPEGAVLDLLHHFHTEHTGEPFGEILV